ncbi:MAG: tripartite tricarboxylate transporter substrate binding protein [Deltaproteobacteria bacterium]|nr:tripartite tricarboxylate transporter substrate binding protein [Deltaproteobacteria bacterium]
MSRRAALRRIAGIVSLAVAGLLLAGSPAAAWEPRKPVEFVIMAGAGGGADIYARYISSQIEKNRLAPVPFVPVNRAGGAGAVAMEYVKGKAGDPHVIMITLSSFIMTPIEQKLPFNWKTYTPIALLALDHFFLWVHQESPWKTMEDFVREARTRSVTVSGTGTKQEDELIFAFFQQKAGMKPMKYVPFKGGGDVAASLVGRQVEATVNNPSEGLPFYPARLRPLAVFADKRVRQFPDLPTMKERGFDIEYRMIRGIFGPPAMPREAQEYYVTLMKRVFDLPVFQKFLSDNVLDPTFMTGPEFVKWLEGYDAMHREVMTKAGWVK